MKNDWMQGVFAGAVAIALAAVAYAQQSTPPPATDFAPAAPAAISASPTTDTAAPAASVTSGAAATTGALDDRANEQTAEAASTGSSTATSAGGLPRPEPRATSPLDRQLGSGVGGGGSSGAAGTSNSQIASQRGELGVWLVETGGPGVRVRRVTEGSAAALAGLQAGDVILGINGQGASSPYNVAQLIRQMQPGQAAMVQYWRNGQTNELDIVLQPAREYEVGFRGEGSMNGVSRSSGDLESRTMRLEQQLATVMQELRQLRQEMLQMRGSGSSQTTIGGGGVGEATTATGFNSSTGITSPAAGATTTQPATTPTGTAPQNDPFGDSPAPTAQPGATPSAEPTPATEPSATPAESDATPEAAPAATESDEDLFN